MGEGTAVFDAGLILWRAAPCTRRHWILRRSAHMVVCEVGPHRVGPLDQEASVDDRPYIAPALTVIGTVRELTEQVKPDKCGGSGDFALPQLLSNDFGSPTCTH